MAIESESVSLCMDGTRAEFEGRLDDAQALYAQAWSAARDDYDFCVAAHYLARFQPTPEESLNWNQVALAHAEEIKDDSVTGFYPSLYVNLGRSHELLGHSVEAQHYYKLAADLGLIHQED